MGVPAFVVGIAGQQFRSRADGVDLRAGEATFVADPDGSGGEGEGWVLTYVYDRTTDTSQLVVLDALECAKGPVATVKLPVRVPYGFHGWWVPSTV